MKRDADSEFLSYGISFSFKLTGMCTTFKEVDMHNYTSATNSAARATMEETIRDEIREGNCYFYNQIDGRKHQKGILFMIKKRRQLQKICMPPQ